MKWFAKIYIVVVLVMLHENITSSQAPSNAKDFTYSGNPSFYYVGGDKVNALWQNLFSEIMSTSAYKINLQNIIDAYNSNVNNNPTIQGDSYPSVSKYYKTNFNIGDWIEWNGIQQVSGSCQA